MALVVKTPPATGGDIRGVGSIPGSGRSPGGGHGNPFQRSCLGNSVDRGAWRATVYEVTKSWTRLKWLSTHACNFILIQFQIQKSPRIVPRMFRAGYPCVPVAGILSCLLFPSVCPRVCVCVCVCVCAYWLLVSLICQVLKQMVLNEISHCSCGFVSFFPYNSNSFAEFCIIRYIIMSSVRIFCLKSILNYDDVSLRFFWWIVTTMCVFLCIQLFCVVLFLECFL